MRYFQDLDLKFQDQGAKMSGTSQVNQFKMAAYKSGEKQPQYGWLRLCIEMAKMDATPSSHGRIGGNYFHTGCP